MIKAFFFDMDGVIIDTEKDGHRVAFNKTFKDFGFNVEWSVEKYHELLQIAGGKERMKHYLHTEGFGKGIDPDNEENLIKEMHAHKTKTFIELLQSGALPLRTGVKRFMKEVNELGTLLSICTTSNELAAKTVAENILSDIKFEFVLAGDIVNNKKPDPEIYILASKKAGLIPKECIVIEDSRNGVEAAKSAGMYVVATTNQYTEKENLDNADVIVTSLGDPQGKKGELKKINAPKKGKTLYFNGVLKPKELISFFS